MKVVERILLILLREGTQVDFGHLTDVVNVVQLVKLPFNAVESVQRRRNLPLGPSPVRNQLIVPVRQLEYLLHDFELLTRLAGIEDSGCLRLMILHYPLLELEEDFLRILNGLRLEGRDRQCVGVDAGAALHLLPVVTGVRKAPDQSPNLLAEFRSRHFVPVEIHEQLFVVKGLFLLLRQVVLPLDALETAQAFKVIASFFLEDLVELQFGFVQRLKWRPLVHADFSHGAPPGH